MNDMTRTDFLLARITEREAAITYAHEHGMSFPVLSPAEMLADCEAKRRVVRLARECERQGYENAAAYMADAIAAHAAVYADHPDYRAEWKP